MRNIDEKITLIRIYWKEHREEGAAWEHVGKKVVEIGKRGDGEENVIFWVGKVGKDVDKLWEKSVRGWMKEKADFSIQV